MEATALSIGKSVLNGVLSYAKSAMAEEVALQLGVRRDQLFITNELEMMQAFLESAHDEGDDNKVVKVWVKQVRDVSYDVEDTLQEFAVRLEKKSWWRIRRMLLDRRRVAKQMKELRASVEDVSQRNMRYNLIKGSRSKSTIAFEQSNIISAALFGIDEARHAAKQDKSNVDLFQLIITKGTDLRVIAVWGTTVDLGQTSIIRAVYENPYIRSMFSCRAWVRMMHPCNPKDFVQSCVEQFHANVGINVLLEKKKTVKELTDGFTEFVNKKRYLIVINDLSTIEEWDRVKRCFPNNNMGSRIIVATPQVEVASLCAGRESIVSELKQLSTNQNIYAFHKKDSRDATDLAETESSSNRSTTINDTTSEILEDQSKGDDGKNVVGKSLTRIRTTTATALEESHVVGREKEKYEIINLGAASQATVQLQVISVCGMGGLGKTTLVKDIYHNNLSGMFEKHACVTVTRPFSLVELLQSLVLQLDREPYHQKDVEVQMNTIKKPLILITLVGLIKELSRLLERKRCLIVLDDVSSAAEWDMIKPIFREMENAIRIIVTTREEDIAKHCSEKKENIYKLKGLEYKDARDLFTKKVFKETIDLDKQYPELVEQAELILRKCNRLPLAIVTIGGFLATQPIKALEWRKLNDHISAELEINPMLGTIRTVLMRSYDGLPYHLKSCFLYTPIFPEDYQIRRRRLVRRWTAEGYPREVRGKSAEEISDGYFLDLISRSMILPSEQSIYSTEGIDSCQVHDLIREIGISKSMEENLVFTLEEGCSTNNQGTMRHLAISGNWKRDQSEFESIVDMSRVRSLTVFGEYKSFFISDKMSVLRVLDLEDTTCLYDHHLKHIGKLLLLRYLSLRGCDIYHLPDSLGNLRELQTLDVRGTSVRKLPKSIINLQKLNNLCAGLKQPGKNNSYKSLIRCCRECNLPFYLFLYCLLWCRSNFPGQDGINHRDLCTIFCCTLLPDILMHRGRYGVVVPRGMSKLKALRTLGVVNIARRGKVILQDIKGLTQLCKLAVTGVRKENGQELCSAVIDLSRLESLSIRSEGEPGLSCCLDGAFSFPESLHKLKLDGYLMKLPEWIQGLKNLVKLKLERTMLLDVNANMEILGNLANLASLHLLHKSFNHGESGVSLKFPPGVFLNLVVLELHRVGGFNSVVFEGGATTKLETLRFFYSFVNPKVGLFSGLPSLPSLKQFMLNDYKYPEEFMEELRGELAKNQNGPVLKRV